MSFKIEQTMIINKCNCDSISKFISLDWYNNFFLVSSVQNSFSFLKRFNIQSTVKNSSFGLQILGIIQTKYKKTEFLEFMNELIGTILFEL